MFVHEKEAPEAPKGASEASMPPAVACGGDRLPPILHKLKRDLKLASERGRLLDMRPAATMKPAFLMTLIACARLA